MNKNNYEITEVPCSECGDIDYRDIMNMSTQGEYVAQQSVVLTAMNTSFQVIRTLYQANKGTLSKAGGVIKSIFTYLWRQKNSQEEWDNFMKAVEILIAEELSTYARNDAIASVRGLENVLNEYQEALDDLALDPTNSALKDEVKRWVTTVHGQFEATMPTLAVGGYEVQQLVAYAEAANLHLAFLRDVAKFGYQWDLDKTTVANYYKDLKENTQIYTDHCVRTYNTGLEKTKSLMGAINPKDYNKYPYLNPYANGSTNFYKKVLQWNVWNDFRRDMTIMVLDLVALWPTFDPEVYTNPEGVDLELSREVYSTAYGRYGSSTHGGDWKSWEVMETAVDRSPHLVSFLTNLAIYQKTYSSSSTNTKLDQYDGVINTLKTVGSTSTFEDGFAPISKEAYRSVKNIPGEYINGVDLRLGMVPCSLTFKTYSSGTFFAGQCYSHLAQSTFYNLSATIAYHRLSYVNAIDDNFSGYYSGWGIGTWGMGWLHENLKTLNIIHATKSSCIPAVKARILTNSATVIKGPGSTGGDLVKLPGVPSTSDIQVRMNMTREVWKNYRIRIRYATSSSAQLFVGKWTGRWAATANINLAATYSGELTYSAFKLADVPFNITTGEPEFSFELRNNSGGPILIDRIEFIPLEGTFAE